MGAVGFAPGALMRLANPQRIWCGLAYRYVPVATGPVDGYGGTNLVQVKTGLHFLVKDI